MSRENVDRLRAAYEEFNRGNIDVALLHSDFELHQASSIIDTAGVFRGPQAVRDVMAEVDDAFEKVTIEPEEFVEAPDGRIVVRVCIRGQGRGSGIGIDNRIAHLWTFREDKAVRLVVYEEPAEALEAVGLRE